MKPKFEIGQKVRFIGDSERDFGNVVSYSYDLENGFIYKISAVDVDVKEKKLINGFKTCLEGELVAEESESNE